MNYVFVCLFVQHMEVSIEHFNQHMCEMQRFCQMAKKKILSKLNETLGFNIQKLICKPV